MRFATPLAILLVAASASLAAPAAAAQDDAFSCGLRTLSPQFGAAIAEQYAAQGPDADYDELIDETEMERVASACLDLEAADAEAQGERLGENLMAFHLMNAAQAAMEAREAGAAANLESAWSALTAEERNALNVIDNRGQQNEERMVAGLMKLAAAIRPDLDPSAPEGERLLSDVGVYGITRALLESRGLR